jgi:tetratricopeptide (TPR) repeat protein
MTNARFEDLEKRVKFIKTKKYIKIFVVLSVLIAVSYYVVSINQVVVVDKPIHVKEVVKKEIPKKAPKVQKYEPIQQEIKIVKKEHVVTRVAEYDTIKLSPKLNLPSNIKKDVVEVKKEPIIKKSKISLHVKEVKSEVALLERFRVAEDFESAMGLAYLYFNKQNFEKSIYWSKKASKLSSGDESAWLVYAKSKKALGKTEDAIKALHLYLEYFSSTRIEKLLKLYRDKK